VKLTIDASIAVKWFVAEPLREEARRLLAHRLHLHAPEILLSEFANTIWKKVRRGEIEDPQPYFDELANLSGIVALHPGGALVDRAARLAVEIDHPVYDCLYLACAEETAPILITADKRLANKVAGRLPTVDVRYLGAHGVPDEIAAAATALIIGRDKVEKLSAAYEFFAATHESVVAALRAGNDLPPLLTPVDQNLILESPSFKRLADMIGGLTDEERVDLLALGWLGAGLLDGDWRRSFEHASEMAGSVDHGYVAGYGQYWRAGYMRVSHLGQSGTREADSA
jgi:predicted nucleic acid-binding protein